MMFPRKTFLPMYCKNLARGKTAKIAAWEEF
jgi:hypothetical protein